MNARELRQAAVDIRAMCKAALIDTGWIHKEDQRSLKLAEHILSTVRDDDDEPAEDEWQWGLLRLSGCNLNTCQRVYAIWDQVSKESGQTRGQFRSLCRGLGVVLEEGKHAE